MPGPRFTRWGTRRTFLKRRQITSCPLSFVCVAIFFNTISAYFSLSPVKKLPDINPQQQLLPVYTSSSASFFSTPIFFFYSLNMLFTTFLKPLLKENKANEKRKTSSFLRKWLHWLHLLLNYLLYQQINRLI